MHASCRIVCSCNWKLSALDCRSARTASVVQHLCACAISMRWRAHLRDVDDLPGNEATGDHCYRHGPPITIRVSPQILRDHGAQPDRIKDQCWKKSLPHRQRSGLCHIFATPCPPDFPLTRETLFAANVVMWNRMKVSSVRHHRHAYLEIRGCHLYSCTYARVLLFERLLKKCAEESCALGHACIQTHRFELVITHI